MILSVLHALIHKAYKSIQRVEFIHIGIYKNRTIFFSVDTSIQIGIGTFHDSFQ